MTDNGEWQIELPWPARQLSPNARGHWSKRSLHAKRYRHECKILALKAIQSSNWDLTALRTVVEKGGFIHLFIDFYPPDRRGRDDDNIIASFKSGRDGLADALKIDDKHFRMHPFVKRDDPKPGGLVRVSLAVNTDLLREEGPDES